MGKRQADNRILDRHGEMASQGIDFQILEHAPESLPEAPIYEDSDTFLQNLAQMDFSDSQGAGVRGSTGNPRQGWGNGQPTTESSTGIGKCPTDGGILDRHGEIANIRQNPRQA